MSKREVLREVFVVEDADGPYWVSFEKVRTQNRANAEGGIVVRYIPDVGLEQAQRGRDEASVRLTMINEWVLGELLKHENRSRGGQQAGDRHSPRVPVSALHELERLLEAAQGKYTYNEWLKLEAERDSLKAQLAEAREAHFREWVGFRIGDNTPCPRCNGLGVRAYSSTATWRGGIGGQAITSDVCDACWGSGTQQAPWPSRRKALASSSPGKDGKG